jgi:hypothetical protein
LIVKDEQGRSQAEVTFTTVDPEQTEAPVQRPLIRPLKKGKIVGRKGGKPARK